jgi:hypothetical protein
LETERLKFYADVHVATAIADALQREAIDYVRAIDLFPGDTPDVEHLAYANQRGRVLVTQDADFLAFHAQGMQHSGIAYFHQGVGIGYIVGQLLLLHQLYTAEEMRGRVEFL